MTVRIGILGATAIAPIAVIEPAQDLEGVEIAAIAARDPERAAKYAEEYGIARVLPDYQSVIDDPDIDAIYVPTPAALHGHWTKQAIKAGKPVLCEKPFTANAAEAEEVVQAAAEAGVLVMEAMHSLHHPLWTKTKDAIDSGELGEISTIVADFSVPIEDENDIRWNPGLAGGALMDLGVYPVTLLRYLFPGMELLSARAEAEGDVDGFVEAKFRTAGGADATLLTRMDASAIPTQRLEVVGSAGNLVLEQFVHPHVGGKLTVTVGSDVEETVAEGPSSYSLMLQRFAEAVTDGVDPLTDDVTAAETMAAIDEIYEAASLPVRQPLPLV